MKEIGLFWGTDKVYHHGYHRFYEKFLGPLRDKPVSLLEIGIYKGASIDIWKEYFDDVDLYMADIDHGSAEKARARNCTVFEGTACARAVVV